MLTRSLERKLGAAFSLVAAIAGLTAVVAYRASGRERESDAWVSHTFEVQDELHELEALTTFVRHSVTKALNTVGSEALITYALARRLSKRPESADLIPHVDAMRKALGKRIRKSKSKPAPKAATPVTTTESSPVTPSSSTTDPKTK